MAPGEANGEALSEANLSEAHKQNNHRLNSWPWTCLLAALQVQTLTRG